MRVADVINRVSSNSLTAVYTPVQDSKIVKMEDKS